jgi:hypothetical protein
MSAFAAAKPRAHYYVVLYQNQWRITFNDQRYGPYASQRAAIDEADKCARQAHKDGYDAQVLVQGVDNKFRVEWTYGHDPYPPRG